MNYRLAYLRFGEVNWCEALGTVLANDEVVNGVSERGGHPCSERKCGSGTCVSPNMPIGCLKAWTTWSSAKR